MVRFNHACTQRTKTSSSSPFQCIDSVCLLADTELFGHWQEWASIDSELDLFIWSCNEAEIPKVVLWICKADKWGRRISRMPLVNGQSEWFLWRLVKISQNVICYYIIRITSWRINLILLRKIVFCVNILVSLCCFLHFAQEYGWLGSFDKYCIFQIWL